MRRRIASLLVIAHCISAHTTLTVASGELGALVQSIRRRMVGEVGGYFLGNQPVPLPIGMSVYLKKKRLSRGGVVPKGREQIDRG